MLIAIITALSACIGQTPIPTPTPTPTPAPTPSPTPSTTPEPTPSENIRNLIEFITETENLSGYKLIEAIKALPIITNIQASHGFDDSEDYWPLLLSLTPAEQAELGLDISGHGHCVQPVSTEPFQTHKSTFEPVYNIQTHFILCANDDGTGGAAYPDVVTSGFITQVITATNQIYQNAGIQLLFDPNTDFESRKSTLLNQDFTIPPGVILSAPEHIPPLTGQQVADLAKSHTDERQRVAKEYRGKLVILLCDGTELIYDPSITGWSTIPRTWAFSWNDIDFVAMPTRQGDVQGWANLLAHESGHYFHQVHTHVGVNLTDGEANDKSLTDADKALLLQQRAASIITDYLAMGHSVFDGLKAFDGDQLNDTPPDTAENLFHYVNGNECGPQGTVDLQILFAGNVQTYTVQPDRGNVMSYFKHCTNFPMHFSSEQSSGIRKAIEEGNRWHLIGPSMRLHLLDTYVVDAQPRYNAVWRPSTEDEIQVYGWTREDFQAKYDELWDGGWRLHLLDSYVVDNQLRYNAVWRPSTENEIQVYGWTREDFQAKYDELWEGGWRLHLLDSYVIDDQLHYNAVWRPSNEEEFQVYGWTREDLQAQYDELWKGGWRLHLLDSYVVDNQPLYNAVWRPSTEGEFQVYGWTREDFQAQYDELWEEGWRLHLLDTYVIDNQLRYNAIWRPNTEGEIQVYGWTREDFQAKYNHLW
jgi:hypothetical protein